MRPCCLYLPHPMFCAVTQYVDGMQKRFMSNGESYICLGRHDRQRYITKGQRKGSGVFSDSTISRRGRAGSFLATSSPLIAPHPAIDPAPVKT